MDEKIEDALWNAARAIEERVMLTQHAASHASESGGNGVGEKLLRQAEAAQGRAALIRRALMNHAENGTEAAEKQAGDERAEGP